MTSLRGIPSIEQLRQRPDLQRLEAEHGRAALVAALRAEADALRQRLMKADGQTAPSADVASAGLPCADVIARAVEARLLALGASRLVRVVNATGVIVHTNLGRAPLSRTALERIAKVSGGYATLEYDLDAGGRGRRDVHAASLLARVVGSEAAAVVNNNAAATMLILAALAREREVIISRGELVEIGGGFRIPEVMAQSGAILREVGTTNRTRLADYAAAVTDRTGLILRVHRSNFRIEGFTEQPAGADLAALGRERGIPVAEDLGSGWLLTPDVTLPDGSPLPAHLAGLLRQEPSVRASLAAGIDVVCFSGDKLLGGPQAGIIVGRRALVDIIGRHPLMRAFRVDKTAYAALEATLAAYARGSALAEVPVLRMLALTPDEIDTRARALAAEIGPAPDLVVEIVDGMSAIGGGSAPGVPLPTKLLAIRSSTASAAQLEARLRAHTPPVIARVENERLLLDLRTVFPEQEAEVLAALRALADVASTEGRARPGPWS